MGTIDVIGKWSLQESKWNMHPGKSEYGRSLAIAKYDEIINNNEKIDYIIVAYGSRVENHSKDFKTIKEKEVRMDYVMEHYRNQNGNYKIELFFMDADAPIIEDAKLVARYIDQLANSPKTGFIHFVALSKCSIMGFYVPRFFKNPNSFQKMNLYNIAPPYEGTKLASPLIFYKEVKKWVMSKMGDHKLSNLVYQELIKFYESISSNSHMDYDIAMVNGVPDSKKDVYDETLIQNVFCVENIDAVKRLNHFENLITGIDSNTLKEAIRTMNMTGIGLCLLNDIFFEKRSDGAIYVDSQRKVEEVLPIESRQLVSAHHDVNSNIRVMSDVLGIVDDTIGDIREKTYCKK